MPKVRILKNEMTELGKPRFMEGWEPGQVVEMDAVSAAGPIAEGSAELVKGETLDVEAPEDAEATESEVRKPRKVKKPEFAEATE